MILAPNCMCLLNSIINHCKDVGIKGLPRGLAISPTLTELYLEPIDQYIRKYDGVIYYTRYIDDLFILVDKAKYSGLKISLDKKLKDIGLELNQSPEKQYIGSSKSAEFDYLGYRISINLVNKGKKANKVNLAISNNKMDKIKQKIAISLNEHKKNPDFNLLKQRINYLTVLKVIKKSANGVLLGGLAYNYQYVSDQFTCLSSVDDFFKKIINDPRFSLSNIEKSNLAKISFYGAVNKKKQGKFTRSKATNISRVWKNA